MEDEYKQLPKDKFGRIDKGLIREAYFNSRHIKWRPFAEEMGWNPKSSYRKVPAAQWAAEKRAAGVDAHQEFVNSALKELAHQYELDVIHTLKNLPPIVDAMIQLLATKINCYLTSGIKPSASELRDLALALESAVKTKHKSLLMNERSPDILRQEISPIHDQAHGVEENGDNVVRGVIKFRLLRDRDLTSDELSELFKIYASRSS